jgi:DNA-binding NarL/FixJ family response regulator
MPQKINILLVDDHPLVREWLTNLIRQQPDFEVCGETGSAPEALAADGISNDRTLPLWIFRSRTVRASS